MPLRKQPNRHRRLHRTNKLVSGTCGCRARIGQDEARWHLPAGLVAVCRAVNRRRDFRAATVRIAGDVRAGIAWYWRNLPTHHLPRRMAAPPGTAVCYCFRSKCRWAVVWRVTRTLRRPVRARGETRLPNHVETARARKRAAGCAAPILARHWWNRIVASGRCRARSLPQRPAGWRHIARAPDRCFAPKPRLQLTRRARRPAAPPAPRLQASR